MSQPDGTATKAAAPLSEDKVCRQAPVKARGAAETSDGVEPVTS